MKYVSIAILFVILITACSTSKKKWADFKKADCANYYFGRIEAKRLLTEAEKRNLSEQGIQIQEFVFESQYLGSWEHKWVKKSLEKTAIKSLIPFSTQDKLASGMQVQEIKKLSESPGESIVLLQTIATVLPSDLSQFGKIVFSKDHFYRMQVPHNQLFSLLEYPCLRMMSILKEAGLPDN
jgi:hypothetical protein